MHQCVIIYSAISFIGNGLFLSLPHCVQIQRTRAVVYRACPHHLQPGGVLPGQDVAKADQTTRDWRQVQQSPWTERVSGGE